MKNLLKKLENHWSVIFLFLITSLFLLTLANITHKQEQFYAKINVIGASSTDITLRPEIKDSLGVASTSKFILTGSNQFSVEQIQKNLSIRPKFEYTLKKTDGSWEIIPNENLKEDELIKFTFKRASSTKQWAYQVKRPFEVIDELPKHQTSKVSASANIVIRLSHDNFYSPDKFITTSPKISAKISHVGRNIIITPKKPLQTNTLYTITVNKDLPISSSSDKLATDYTFQFQTSASKNSDDKNFENQNKLFKVDSKPTFQQDTNNKSKTRTRIYKFASADEYLETLVSIQQPWWTANLPQRKISLNGLDFLFTTDVFVKNNKIELPTSLVNGYYLADFSTKTSNNQYLFQVSNISAYTNLTTNKILVWANDSRNKPLEGASVSLEGLSENFTTDKSGIATFETPTDIVKNLDNSENWKQYFVKVSSRDEVIFLPLINFQSAFFAQNYNYKNSQHNLVTSNKKSFVKMEKISITGIIASSSNTDLIIKSGLSDYYYNPAVVTKIKLNTSSSTLFSTNLKLANNLPSFYTTEIWQDESLLASNYFQLSNCLQKDLKYRPLASIKSSTTFPNIKLDKRNLYIQYQNGITSYQTDIKQIRPDLNKTAIPNFYFSVINLTDSNYTAYNLGPIPYYQNLKQIKNNEVLNSGNLSNSAIDNSTTELSLSSIQPEYNRDVIKNCEDYNKFTVKTINNKKSLTAYQHRDGGISLNDTSSNLELSMLIAISSRSGFDQLALKQYFINNLDATNSSQHSSLLALVGLISLDEPLLNRLNNWQAYYKKPTIQEKILLAIAYKKLGAVDWANQIIKNIDKKDRIIQNSLINIYFKKTSD